MENCPNYENTPEFEALLVERIKYVQEHPENLIPVEKVLQRGWNKIAKHYSDKDVQA